MTSRRMVRRQPTHRAGRLLAYATAFGVAWIAFQATVLGMAQSAPAPFLIGLALLFTAAGLIKAAG